MLTGAVALLPKFATLLAGKFAFAVIEKKRDQGKMGIPKVKLDYRTITVGINKY